MRRSERVGRMDNKERLIASGAILEDLVSIVIDENVEISPGVRIRPNTIITGNTKIAKGCVIGPNTELDNVVVGSSTIIEHSVIKDSTVGSSCHIGPFAHIRNNTVIGDNDRIGNFVEVKNSKVGNCTNAAHLTYIGDTDAGDHVNFGCGVVTVNYDGKDKHRTNIGSHVFIGCNANLIAPISIGENAFIAAGSTITDDVGDSDFAIARSKQTTKRGYASKYKK